MTAEESVARAKGAKPGMFYSSAQIANGFCDITAPNSGLGAIISREPPAQQSPPPPRTSVPGGEHCQVWGSPGRGLQGGPATPTQAGLGKDVKAWVRQRRFVHRHSSASVR